MKTGEVDASVFDRYRIPLYKEASFKPYIIAAMIMLSKFENPQDILKKLEVKAAPEFSNNPEIQLFTSPGYKY